MYVPVLLPDSDQSVAVRVFVSDAALTEGVNRSLGILALLGTPAADDLFHQAVAQSAPAVIEAAEGRRSMTTSDQVTAAVSAARDSGPSRIMAPIPGKVVAVNVAEGDTVEPGQALVVLEAMKMENELIAEQSGIVATVHAGTGATVEAGELLAHPVLGGYGQHQQSEESRDSGQREIWSY